MTTTEAVQPAAAAVLPELFSAVEDRHDQQAAAEQALREARRRTNEADQQLSAVQQRLARLRHADERETDSHTEREAALQESVKSSQALVGAGEQLERHAQRQASNARCQLERARAQLRVAAKQAADAAWTAPPDLGLTAVEQRRQRWEAAARTAERTLGLGGLAALAVWAAEGATLTQLLTGTAVWITATWLAGATTNRIGIAADLAGGPGWAAAMPCSCWMTVSAVAGAPRPKTVRQIWTSPRRWPLRRLLGDSRTVAVHFACPGCIDEFNPADPPARQDWLVALPDPQHDCGTPTGDSSRRSGPATTTDAARQRPAPPPARN